MEIDRGLRNLLVEIGILRKDEAGMLRIPEPRLLARIEELERRVGNLSKGNENPSIKDDSKRTPA